MIDNANSLEELRVPPANHLEKLSGDRDGQYSNRINDQFRICFTFDGTDFHDVEITDYH
jgi:proteic killer suppression protein